METLLLLSLCMPELGGGDCPPGGREPSAPEPGGRHKRPSVSGGGGTHRIIPQTFPGTFKTVKENMY